VRVYVVFVLENCFVCTHILVQIAVGDFVCVCMCVLCVRQCMYSIVHSCIHPHSDIYVRACACVCVCVCVWVCVCVCVCGCVCEEYVHKYARTCTDECI
jgi:hypothetical protein